MSKVVAGNEEQEGRGGACLRPVLAAIVCFLSVSPAPAQQPPSPPVPPAPAAPAYKNLQVLPKDIPERQLFDTMRGMAGGLGVRCAHCHVGPANGPLSEFDFASDEKPQKATARAMYKMVRDVNERWIAALPLTAGTSAVQVQCVTCHRGQARPRLIHDLVAEVAAEKGVAAAIEEYRRLRAETYGRGAYDFGEGPLSHLAELWLRGGKADDALAVLAVNAEFHPKSFTTHRLTGEAWLAKGDKAKAIASFEKALTIDPSVEVVRRRLEGIKKESGGG